METAGPRCVLEATPSKRPQPAAVLDQCLSLIDQVLCERPSSPTTAKHCLVQTALAHPCLTPKAKAFQVVMLLLDPMSRQPETGLACEAIASTVETTARPYGISNSHLQSKPNIPQRRPNPLQYRWRMTPPQQQCRQDWSRSSFFSFRCCTSSPTLAFENMIAALKSS